MKNLNNKLKIYSVVSLLTIIVSGASAHAQGHIGDIGIICRDENHQIVSARLLDLWEPEKINPNQDFETPVAAQIEDALKSINSFDIIAARELLRETGEDKKYAVFTKKEIPLEKNISSDYIPSNNCNFEEVAQWGYVNELGGTRLRISDEIYNSPMFSNTDRAAVLLREAINSSVVFHDWNTSANWAATAQVTRRLISRLFSHVELDTKLKKWVAELHVLMGFVLPQAIYTDDDQIAVSFAGWWVSTAHYDLAKSNCSIKLTQDGVELFSFYQKSRRGLVDLKLPASPQGVLKTGTLAIVQIECHGALPAMSLNTGTQKFELGRGNNTFKVINLKR